jgi:hypothetical protein
LSGRWLAAAALAAHTVHIPLQDLPPTLHSSALRMQLLLLALLHAKKRQPQRV